MLKIGGFSEKNPFAFLQNSHLNEFMRDHIFKSELNILIYGMFWQFELETNISVYRNFQKGLRLPRQPS